MDITKRELFEISCGTLMPSTRLVRKDAMADMEAAAKAEGMFVSLGMPDDWAKESVTYTDTGMSSTEELAKFKAERANACAGIGEVGLELGPIAITRGLGA